MNLSTDSFVNDIKKIISEAEFSDKQIDQIKNIIASEIKLDVPLANITIPNSIDVDDNIIIGAPTKLSTKKRTPAAKSPTPSVIMNID